MSNPRVLLADEVGLGKTIEAGMILQNQLFAEKVQTCVNYCTGNFATSMACRNASSF